MLKTCILVCKSWLLLDIILTFIASLTTVTTRAPSTFSNIPGSSWGSTSLLYTPQYVVLLTDRTLTYQKSTSHPPVQADFYVARSHFLWYQLGSSLRHSQYWFPIIDGS